jgi:hypothetical protein
MRRFARSVTLLGGILAGACDSPIATTAELYTLTTINGGPLPFPYNGFSSSIEITGGSIELRRDGSYTEVWELRCREPLPPEDECSVGDGTHGREGAYSRSEGWVEYNGIRFPARFSSAEVEIVFAAPSSGFSPLVHEYRR